MLVAMALQTLFALGRGYFGQRVNASRTRGSLGTVACEAVGGRPAEDECARPMGYVSVGLHARNG
jgi:hypothetical protein